MPVTQEEYDAIQKLLPCILPVQDESREIVRCRECRRLFARRRRSELDTVVILPCACYMTSPPDDRKIDIITTVL